MEQFKRLNKNSCLLMYERMKFFSEDTPLTIIEEKYIILQIFDGVNDSIIVEALPRFMDDAEEETPAHTGDIYFENYLETIINKDPFGGKYSGKPIKQVFIDGNKEWLNKALTELKNEFLRDRLQYIMSRGGYGKICRV